MVLIGSKAKGHVPWGSAKDPGASTLFTGKASAQCGCPVMSGSRDEDFSQAARRFVMGAKVRCFDQVVRPDGTGSMARHLIHSLKMDRRAAD